LQEGHDLNVAAQFCERLGFPDKADELRRSASNLFWSDGLVETTLHDATRLQKLGELYLSIPTGVPYPPGKVLTIRRKLLGDDHADVAMSLHQLAAVYLAKGKHQEAAPLCKDAVEIRKRILGETQPDYGASLYLLGWMHESRGDWPKAEGSYQAALEIWERAGAEDHPDCVPCLKRLADHYQSIREDGKAERNYLKAAEIREKTRGESDPKYAESLFEVAKFYQHLGKYRTATVFAEKSLAVRRKSLQQSANVLDLIDYYLNAKCLKVNYAASGDYHKLQYLARQVVDVARQTESDCPPPLAELAEACLFVGDFLTAQSLYQEMLERTQEGKGEKDANFLGILYRLAWVYFREGDFGNANALYRRVLEIVKKTEGETTTRYARALGSLAKVQRSSGDDAKAESLLQEALLALDNRDQKSSWILNLLVASKRDQEIMIDLYNELAEVYCVRGEFVKAAEYYAKTENDFALATGVYPFTGEYDKAEAIVGTILKGVQGGDYENTPFHAHLLQALAVIQARSGKLPEGLRSFNDELVALRRHTGAISIGLPERQVVAYLRTAWPSLERGLSFVQQHPQLPGAAISAAEWLVRWKGLAAEIATQRQRLLRASDDAQTRGLLEELAAAQHKLAEMTLSPPAGKTRTEIQMQRRNAEKSFAELESKLSEKSSQLGELQRLGNADLATVARSLPADSALLDYANFRQFDFQATTAAKQWGDLRYLLFITVTAQPAQPVMVDLGPAKPIDDAIGDFRRALAKIENGQKPDSDEEIRGKLMAVRKLIVDPVMPYVRDKKHWVVCPDGQLWLIPFESLPLEDGKYLIELKTVSYLGAGREAVAHAGAVEGTMKSNPAVLVGNPDFDLPLDDQQAEFQRVKTGGPALAVRGVGGSRELRQVLFLPLPATGPEVEAAAKLTGGVKYVRRQALEGVVKQVSGPEVLYLATHGFFLADQLPNPKNDVLSVQAFASRGSGFSDGMEAFVPADVDPRIENPLLRCGLALAGANRRESVQGRDDVEDGILTGVEVAGLDLQCTQLVLLSACQTGLGDMQQGEGVIGLRRAFLLAGARRVLSTLWMVGDRPTQELMTDFINRWKAGKPAIAALRDAQIAMIQKMRKEHGHAHPFYWAAFTMTGDWR
jgi:CHAT domain-containing protein